MLRNPKQLCYNGLLLLGQPYPSLLSSCHPRSRPYATAHGDFSENDLSWPSTPSFTPYDVFGQARSAPYSKQRYYDLVKIYHPDRPCNGHPLCKDISPEVRLQRYRIVVTAHEILSDPTKRAAYDRTGTGWSFSPIVARRGSDPIYSNATWEDWERWHNRNEPKQQNIVDHKTFVTFVILLFFMGGALQASWITQVSTGYDDKLRELNEQSTRFLNERRKHTVNQMTSADAKVQHFLVRRDPSGYGLKEEEQGVYKEVLSPKNSPSPAEALEPAPDRPKGGQDHPTQADSELSVR
ncbi:hypothetical protein BJX68DRAFT_89605 [Aspergillus pseudodeflectus]|uniref:J domain-containing protein n=1 Tax=Aspergillus pseudodeflectus TaxID=176178 RepID=A0ABR4L7V7_9EURO